MADQEKTKTGTGDDLRRKILSHPQVVAWSISGKRIVVVSWRSAEGTLEYSCAPSGIRATDYIARYNVNMHLTVVGLRHLGFVCVFVEEASVEELEGAWRWLKSKGPAIFEEKSNGPKQSGTQLGIL